MLRPDEPGLRVALGISGSGKTHGVRADVLRAVRLYPVVVIDFAEEWTSVPASYAPHTRGAKDFAEAKVHLDAGARLVVVRPPPIDGALVAAVESACAWARERPGLAGVAIPEAHNVAPVTRIPPILWRVATAWRHSGVSLWCDTQRVAALHHGITENAREIRVYAHVGDTDLKRLRDIGNQALADAAKECARRLAPPSEGGDGQAGWHVTLGLIRSPPYRLTREA